MKHYDVAVCGGGFAGISAALAAAREGKKVILFEKEYMLGGLGTAGLVTIYLPLCDGFGHQVSFNIAEELLKLSITYGAEDQYPENWLDGVGTKTEKDKRYEVRYNAQLFAILAENLLIDHNVDILYGSYVIAVSKLPQWASNVVSSLGDCMSPVAMLLTGVTVSKIRLGKIFRDYRLYVISLIRLLAFPLLFVLLARFIPFADTVFTCAACALAMPLGLSPVVVPAAYGKDTSTAAGLSVVSHLLSCISIPIVFMLVQ